MRQDDDQWLREENAVLREENATLRALVAELLPLKKQVEELSVQVKELESRLTKDSHNSHLPPSSDRLGKPAKTKSLRKQSGKQPGAQPGHEGNTLYQVHKPDQIIVHEVSTCASCQQDLSQEPPLQIERRHVLDIPPKRVIVIEHQAQQKCCPHCQEITRAVFPEGISAPVQYGPAFGALGVYLDVSELRRGFGMEIATDLGVEPLKDVLHMSENVRYVDKDPLDTSPTKRVQALLRRKDSSFVALVDEKGVFKSLVNRKALLEQVAERAAKLSYDHEPA